MADVAFFNVGHELKGQPTSDLALFLLKPGARFEFPSWRLRRLRSGMEELIISDGLETRILEVTSHRADRD